MSKRFSCLVSKSNDITLSNVKHNALILANQLEIATSKYLSSVVRTTIVKLQFTISNLCHLNTDL
jgi:hypothetical protein